MTQRRTIHLLVLLAAATGLVLAAPADAKRKKKGKNSTTARKVDYKLKAGAMGKICFDCHTDFSSEVKKKSVHTPVKRRDCVGCHSPHASEHGAMLSAELSEVCDTCHDKVPKDAVSKHAPARKGQCGKCHEVHAADNAPLLTKPEADTCAHCHGDIVRAATKAKRKHRPLEKTGCRACHDAHASSSPRLLTKPPEQLCAGCHKTDKRRFASKHLGYPVATAQCTGCHNPHGSNQPGMLRNSVHEPVAKRACGQCHEGPSASNPLATKKTGAKLCRTCHSKEVAKMMNKDRVHWALLDARSCLNCHNPHASDAGKLLKADLGGACGACHSDTIARYRASKSKHKPVENDCSTCHEPHSSDNVLLFKKPNPIQLCGTCHDWTKHSSHPVGNKYRDPRNQNLAVTCLSCHRSHGTPHEHLLPYATTTELCVQCHENYRR